MERAEQLAAVHREHLVQPERDPAGALALGSVNEPERLAVEKESDVNAGLTKKALELLVRRRRPSLVVGRGVELGVPPVRLPHEENEGILVVCRPDRKPWSEVLSTIERHPERVGERRALSDECVRPAEDFGEELLRFENDLALTREGPERRLKLHHRPRDVRLGRLEGRCGDHEPIGLGHGDPIAVQAFVRVHYRSSARSCLTMAHRSTKLVVEALTETSGIAFFTLSRPPSRPEDADRRCRRSSSVRTRRQYS